MEAIDDLIAAVVKDYTPHRSTWQDVAQLPFRHRTTGEVVIVKAADMLDYMNDQWYVYNGIVDDCVAWMPADQIQRDGEPQRMVECLMIPLSPED